MANQFVKGSKVYHDPDGANTGRTGIQPLGIPARAYDEEETTPVETTSRAKEFEPTLYEEGAYPIEILYDPANALHVAIKALGVSAAFADWQVALPSSTETRNFSAYVKAWQWLTPKNGKLRASFELRQTGASVIS